MIVAWYDQCFKTRTGDHSVKVLGHWSDRMTIEPGLYKNIYDQKLYYEWNFDKKKSCHFFFLFKVGTLKISLQVNFLIASQFKLIPIQIQISSYIKQ